MKPDRFEVEYQGEFLDDPPPLRSPVLPASADVLDKLVAAEVRFRAERVQVEAVRRDWFEERSICLECRGAGRLRYVLRPYGDDTGAVPPRLATGPCESCKGFENAERLGCPEMLTPDLTTAWLKLCGLWLILDFVDNLEAFPEWSTVVLTESCRAIRAYPGKPGEIHRRVYHNTFEFYPKDGGPFFTIRPGDYRIMNAERFARGRLYDAKSDRAWEMDRERVEAYRAVTQHLKAATIVQMMYEAESWERVEAIQKEAQEMFLADMPEVEYWRIKR